MNEVEAAIYSKLSADSTLTTLLGGTAIYASIAPQDATPPYVVFHKQSERDVHALASRTAYDFLYTVKAVTQSPGVSPDKALGGSVDARVDALLNGGSLSISGHTFLTAYRESGVDYSEVEQGLIYHHIGGVYRIWST